MSTKGPQARIPQGAHMASALDARPPRPTLSIPRAEEPPRPAPPPPAPTRPASPPPAKPAEPREDFTPENTSDALGSEFERVGLPSGFAFYEWQEISVRRLDVFDQAKLTRAVRHQNMTLLLDVLSSTSNRDVRDLCVSDFRALCLWHKTNSYLKNSLSISYNSMYGNRVNNVTPQRVSVKEVLLQKTRAEYLERCARGLAVPTARDIETLSGYDIDEELLLLFERAQYINIEPLQERIAQLTREGDRTPSITARIEQLGAFAKGRKVDEVYEELDDFATDFSTFGVQEIAYVYDTKFEPNAALDYLDKVLADTEPTSETYQNALEETKRIRTALESNQPVKGKLEEVPLTFDQWTMFPYT